MQQPITVKPEASIGGKLDQRNMHAQTMNIYEITTDMVFHGVETKVRELVKDLVMPMDE